jgi:ankyrin repeat protein
MAPKVGKESLLELCTRATELGNSISVRMLEYLSTTKNYPHGFRELATDFLEICRILWPIEAGLTEAARARSSFPTDMIHELDKKFRSVIDEFIVLNQMLLQFLGYESKKGFSKFRKGWGMMFAESEIVKMRDSLGKSRDALRMSALVFRWSLGDSKANANAGIGYTGLEAALESMNRGKTTSTIKPLSQASHQPLHPPPDMPLPRPPIESSLSGSSRSDTVPGRNDSYQLPKLPLSFDGSTSTIRSGHDLLPLTPQSEHAQTNTYMAQHDDTIDTLNERYEEHSLKIVPSIRSSRHLGASPGSHKEFHKYGARESDLMSSTTGEFEDMLMQLEDDKHTFQAVRIKVDPKAVPRWTPKSTGGANSPGLRNTLITAVQQKKHNVVEQLLDNGVSPDVGPDANVLREAALNRDVETLRLLLLFGADVNATDRKGFSALHAATEMCFIEGAKLLCEYGASPNFCGEQEESPLAMSVVGNRAEFLQLFLKFGGDVNEIMPNGSNVFIGAMTKTINAKLVDLMIKYDAEPNGKTQEGTTALFQCIQAHRVDLMTLLLDAGADPNLPGPKHPLWPSTYKPQCLQLLLARGADPKKAPGIMELATSVNNIESISILLKSGVSPNIRKDGVYTPLCSAIRDNRPQIVSLLLASKADPNLPASEYPAFKCVTHNRIHFLPELVAAGADLHKPKGILEKAVKHNNMDALLYLIGEGVNCNDRSSEGYTPLTTAIRDNRLDFVDILLAHGADPSVRGQEWPVSMAVKHPEILKKLLPAVHNPRAVKGVMEMAVVANQLDSIKLLLAAGVSVEDKNGGVFSPLTTSIREDRKEIFRYLIDEAGADVNTPGEHLPIIKAIRRHRGNDLSYIEALLEKGADINLMYRGWNAVLQAVEMGEANLLRLLVERGGGVDLQAKDESDRTVMEIVSERGWDEAVEILSGSDDERRGVWPK